MNRVLTNPYKKTTVAAAHDPDEELDSKETELRLFKAKNLRIGLLKKHDALIYILISRHNNETASFIRDQLESLHANLLSCTTASLMRMLQQNPGFDVSDQIKTCVPLLKRSALTADKNVGTFTDTYLPLRTGTDDVY